MFDCNNRSIQFSSKQCLDELWEQSNMTSAGLIWLIAINSKACSPRGTQSAIIPPIWKRSRGCHVTWKARLLSTQSQVAMRSRLWIGLISWQCSAIRSCRPGASFGVNNTIKTEKQTHFSESKSALFSINNLCVTHTEDKITFTAKPLVHTIKQITRYF